MNKPNITMRKVTLVVLLWSMTISLISAQTGNVNAYDHIFSISSESEGNLYLQNPCDIAVDEEGFVYLADQQQNKILKLNRDGNLVKQWGVPGAGMGQFNGPKGIAFGSDGHLFVLDAGNYRVQKFTKEGEFVLSFGSIGTQSGQFLDPLAIAADANGNIFVSEGDLGARIQRFDLKGSFIDRFGSSTIISGELGTPKGLAISAKGTLLVADSSRFALLEYNYSGELLKTITVFETDQFDSSFAGPIDVGVDREGRIYVLDRLIGSNRIYYFDKDYNFLGIYFNNGQNFGQLITPKGLGVDSLTNRVYLTDVGRGKLIRYTTNLVPVIEVGTNSLSGLGQLAVPAGVGLSSGLVYISDPENDEVKTYRTSDFGFTGLSYRGNANGPGTLKAPGSLGVTSQGELFVVDGRQSIKKFRADGTFEDSTATSQDQRFNGIHVDPNGNHLIALISPSSSPTAGFREFGPNFSLENFSTTFDFLAPYGITRDKSGFVYVSDTSSNTVKVYNPGNGFGFSRSFEAPKVAPFSFSGPLSLAVDHRGNILIADTGNHRILKYNSQGEFLAAFGSYGSMPGQFFHPIDIKADGTGRVYVVDAGNRRVQVLRTCQVINAEERMICEGDSTLFEGIFYKMSGQFDRTFVSEDGCDSIRRLDLTVVPAIRNQIDSTICSGESVSFFGDTYNETGVYESVFSSRNGCDSIVTLQLDVAPVYDVNAEITICEGDFYAFGDQVLNRAGNYMHVFESKQGCDSTVNLTLMVSDTLRTQLVDTICIGDTLRVGDQIFTQTTEGRVVFSATENRCDSVVEISLTVLDTFRTFRMDTICQGDTLLLGEQILTTTGRHEIVFSENETRCDSTVVVDLVVLDTFFTIRNEIICIGDTLTVGRFDLTRSGTYDLVFPPTENRCDSTVRVNLTVLDTFYTQRFDTICRGETLLIGEETFSESGRYTVVFPMNNMRCDSTVEVNLTVLDTFRTLRTDTICQDEFLSINGRILSSAGQYEIVFPGNDVRCDSTVVVDLTVLPVYRTERSDTICSGETLVVGGQEFTRAGVYQVVFPRNKERCDSTVIVDLTVLTSYNLIEEVTICEGETFTVGDQSLSRSGQIVFPGKTREGCDSTLTYNVRVKPSYFRRLDTAICVGERLTIGNTSFRSPGVFEYTFPENELRCDSVLEINLSFKDTFLVRTEVTICRGDTFVLGSQKVFEAGQYSELFPENNRRCDSLVFLDLRVLEPSFDTLDLELCPGDVLFFGSVRVDGPGHYDAKLRASNGCDSLVHIRVSPRPPKRTFLDERVCEVEGYRFDGQILRRSGTYSDTLRASNGCDSIVMLQLSVEPTLISRSEVTICAGETYTFSGDRLSRPGLYRDSFLAQTGCYFYLELDLTVLPSYLDTTYAEICSGQSYVFENEVYTESGFYTHVYESSGGCDSIRYLSLEVMDPIQRSLEASICSGDTFTFQEMELTQSGIYRDTMKTEAGCDSIVILFLDVFQSQQDTIKVQLCGEQAYEFAGQFIDTEGIYTDTLTSRLGCDSIVTVEVSFEDAPANLVTVGGVLMTANLDNADYQWVNCRDTTPIPNATSQFFIPSFDGHYAVIIEDDDCIYLSECFQMNVGNPDPTTSTREPDISDQFNLYPNPVKKELNLVWYGSPGQRFEWRIMDAAGRQVVSQSLQPLEVSNQISVMRLPPGLYWLVLRSGKGEIARLRFVRSE